MGTVLVYIHFSIFDEIYKKKNRENIFHSHILCSFLFIFLFFHNISFYTSSFYTVYLFVCLYLETGDFEQ